jgi:beta-xylosidase
MVKAPQVMKKSLIYFTILFVLLLSGKGLAKSANVTPEAIAAGSNWVDDFDSQTLDSRWFWIGEDPSHWSLSANPGYMSITTQEGSLYLDSNDMKNLLLTPVSSQDFGIQIKGDFSPSENDHSAGLYIYQDDDNYIRLVRRYFESNQQVQMYYEENGFSNSSITIDETSTSGYLRIDKEGESYMGFYSMDGIHWDLIGQVIGTLSDPKVGIGASGGAAIAEISADVDFFQLSTVDQHIYLPLLIK